MQDLEKFKNEMNLSGKNVYVGHRYVPKLMGEWDNAKTYEALSIVQYQGNSFTSRQNVPIGIEITNDEFWAATGNYNAQVENYRLAVIENNTKVENYHQEVLDSLTDIDGNTFETLTGRLQDIDNQFKDVSIFRNVLDYGVKNDGTDTEDALNALEGGYTYVFPSGEYGVKGFTETENETGFKIKSNTRYIFEPNAKIKVLNNASLQYAGVLIQNAENFILDNITVVGERYEHNYTIEGTHERGSGIVIRGKSTGKILNPTITETTGDGIDIIASLGSDIYIFNPQVTDVRRNGISIESVDKLLIENGEVSLTNGTNPQAGIDIEPFADYNILNDVKIRNVKTHSNVNRGLLFAGLYFLDNYNIKIDDCTIDGLEFSQTYFTGYDFVNRKIEINNPKINGQFGIKNINAAPHVVINNPVIEIKNGVKVNAAIDIKRTNAISNAPFGAMEINNAKILNTKAQVEYPISIDVEDALAENRSIGVTKIEITENKIGGVPVKFSDVPNINMPDLDIKCVNNKVDYSSGTADVPVLLAQHVTNNTATNLTIINLTNELNRRSLLSTIEIEVTNAPIQINGTGVYSNTDNAYKIYPFNSQKIRCDIIGGKVKLRYAKSNVDNKPIYLIDEIVGTWKEVTT